MQKSRRFEYNIDFLRLGNFVGERWKHNECRSKEAQDQERTNSSQIERTKSRGSVTQSQTRMAHALEIGTQLKVKLL